MPNRYNLPGFQVEPEAAFWLEYPNPLRGPLHVARIEEITALTEPDASAPRLPAFAIDPAGDFPDTQPELIPQFLELVLLSFLRDRALPTDDPTQPGAGGSGAPVDGFSGVAAAFSTDVDAAQAGKLSTGTNSFVPDSVRDQVLALAAQPAPALERRGGMQALVGAGIDVAAPDALVMLQPGTDVFTKPGTIRPLPVEDLAQSVTRLGRRFPARVTPLSAFLNLQPAPFGAIFNVARAGSQTPITDVLAQDQRINLPPAVILTGRELSRAFENETPGLYHRHALNWLLFNRADVSPPRHARVWAALDMAIYSALSAAWHYKWQSPAFRYLQRPWEYNHFLDVLFDRVVNNTGSGDGAPRTCPEPTPGTPRHPAWPSGHSTYSAAASYVLEYFFSGEASLGRSYQQVLQAARNAPPFGTDWIALHLRRLANNVGEARLFAGVHWRGDHVAGQKIGRAGDRRSAQGGLRARLHAEGLPGRRRRHAARPRRTGGPGPGRPRRRLSGRAGPDRSQAVTGRSFPRHFRHLLNPRRRAGSCPARRPKPPHARTPCPHRTPSHRPLRRHAPTPP